MKKVLAIIYILVFTMLLCSCSEKDDGLLASQNHEPTVSTYEEPNTTSATTCVTTDRPAETSSATTCVATDKPAETSSATTNIVVDKTTKVDKPTQTEIISTQPPTQVQVTEKIIYELGEPANYYYICDGYTITVVSAEEVYPPEYANEPDAAYVFLRVRLENKNTAESINPYLILTSLIDSKNNVYAVNFELADILDDADNCYYKFQNKSIIPGGNMEGYLVYKLKKDHGDLTMRFPTETLHLELGYPYYYFKIPDNRIRK